MHAALLASAYRVAAPAPAYLTFLLLPLPCLALLTLPPSYCPCSADGVKDSANKEISLEDVKDPAKRTEARKQIAKVEASIQHLLMEPEAFCLLNANALCFHHASRPRVFLFSLQVFTEKHKEGKNAWFFSKLRF